MITTQKQIVALLGMKRDVRTLDGKLDAMLAAVFGQTEARPAQPAKAEWFDLAAVAEKSEYTDRHLRRICLKAGKAHARSVQTAGKNHWQLRLASMDRRREILRREITELLR